MASVKHTVSIDLQMSFGDDFADGTRGWRWDIFGDTPTESGGVLNCDKDNSGGGSGVSTGYETSFNVTGDFDVQVDYIDFVRVSGTAAIRLSFYISEDDNAWVYRYNTGAENRIYADGYVSGGYYISSIDTAVNTGKFRLKRVGTTMYHYCDVGAGWVLLHTRNPFSAAAGTIRIYSVAAASSEVQGDFDNVVVRAGLQSGLELYGTDGIRLTPTVASWTDALEMAELPDAHAPAWTKNEAGSPSVVSVYPCVIILRYIE